MGGTSSEPTWQEVQSAAEELFVAKKSLNAECQQLQEHLAKEIQRGHEAETVQRECRQSILTFFWCDCLIRSASPGSGNSGKKA